VRTTKQQARHAGLLYLILGLLAPVGLLYVPGKLIVSGNAAATADNIRASEWLLRVLYRLFKAVNETHARQLVILGALVSVPIVFVNVLNEIAALALVSGAGYLSAFETPQLNALAYLFLHVHDQGITVVSIFWGLWLLPFGLLVIRSGFIPRVLGVLLLIAGTAYVVAAFATLVVPRYATLISQIALPFEVAELPIIFWLLIWGARVRPADATAA